MRPALLLALLLPLAACAAQKTPATQECAALYLPAPGNYVVDLAAGARVYLDPAAHEFTLYCTPREADKALAEMVGRGLLAKDDWRVYRLAGDPAEISRVAGERRILASPARLADWLM